MRGNEGQGREAMVVPLLDETIGTCFDLASKRYADREALVVVHQQVYWTYRQLRVRVDSLAIGLLGLGLLFAAELAAPALGQPAGGPGSFLAVTAKPEAQSYHVVWVLDLPSDKLYALYPQNASKRDVVATQPRELARDFEK